MIETRVDALVKSTGATLVLGSGDMTCHGCVIDSRKVREDCAFVAFPGERVDGNDYAIRAVEAGAACVVITREPWQDLLDAAAATSCAVVRAEADDAEEFLLRLAGAWRADNPWAVVGVTGSVGKTTTKDMVACALSARFRTHATKGNLNNLIGVPLTLLDAPADAQVVVVEMGMNHAGEITRLVRCARPQLAVITNVGTAHVGLLGSRDAIARAKAEIVAGPADPLPADVDLDAALVLTATDDYAPLIEREYAEPARVDVLRVGLGTGDDVVASDVILDDEARPSFDVTVADGRSAHLSLLIAGRAAVCDCVLALAVALRLGVDLDAASDALGRLAPADMRQQMVRCPGGWRVIDDTYNASPSSMAAALDVLCEVSCEGRRIAVLGEMGELGDEAVRLHELVGAYLAAKPLDLVVFVGHELAGRMHGAARLMGLSDDKVATVPDAASALALVRPLLRTGDLVLAKASNACGLNSFARGIEA